MSCTILITGSNGLLGQKLVHLLKEKYNVIATSLGSCLISDQSGFIYQSLDITNQQAVQKIVLECTQNLKQMNTIFV